MRFPNVRVEKRSHRALASFRSKVWPSGRVQARAHPLDRSRPVLIPGEGNPRGHRGNDFQLVSGFQAKVLDRCLWQPYGETVTPSGDTHDTHPDIPIISDIMSISDCRIKSDRQRSGGFQPPIAGRLKVAPTVGG